jgi:hypothetical protein
MAGLFFAPSVCISPAMPERQDDGTAEPLDEKPLEPQDGGTTESVPPAPVDPPVPPKPTFLQKAWKWLTDLTTEDPS